MTPSRSLIAIALAIASCVVISAADLQDGTVRAYNQYAEEATRTFLERTPATAVRDGEVMVRPGREDGIIGVPDGLVHHWIGSTFMAGVTLQDALDVSFDYDNYHTVYKPVIASRLLGRDGDTFRVTLRIKESGAGLSAVLDVTSRVQYTHPDAHTTYSISTSEEIHEIEKAGTPRERRLSPGHDSGYLWRAATFNRLVERDHGVFVESEALGVSRRFPPLLRWIIEPIARRLGRSSVERSLLEFSIATRARARVRTMK